MIILEEDPVQTVANLLKVEVYQVFYLAAQDECLGHPAEIAAHRQQKYFKEGYATVPDYVKTFCEEMKQALRKIERTI